MVLLGSGLFGFFLVTMRTRKVFLVTTVLQDCLVASFRGDDISFF